MALLLITPYRMGGALVQFDNERLHRRAVRAMQCQTADERRSTLRNGVLMQNDHQVEELLTGRPRALRDYRACYTVRIRMDSWDIANRIYGWDAHLAFE